MLEIAFIGDQRHFGRRSPHLFLRGKSHPAGIRSGSRTGLAEFIALHADRKRLQHPSIYSLPQLPSVLLVVFQARARQVDQPGHLVRSFELLEIAALRKQYARSGVLLYQKLS